jgi:hypothetical protein
MSNLWNQCKKLLADGISVIPIRDKDETSPDGKVYTKKSPFKMRWQEYQQRICSESELFFLLEKFETTAIATICGKISKNMEGIDVDSKYNTEILKPLFEAIKQQFPDIKFKIAKTPSGGYHIIYRIQEGVIPPNKKLALRLATEEELAINPKSKTRCFIETRGEGGYLAAYPTDGYELINDVPIPILTWQQREDLISICTSFNQVLKEDAYKPSKQDNIYYSENPFESFNKSNDAEQVLLKNGWTFHSRNAERIFFSRPGSKSKGIHAVFFTKTMLYQFFTTNCEFENERRYNASTVRAQLEFNGDKKKLFIELVNSGYGKIKANKEKELVKHAVINNQPLPANISQNAKESLQQLQENLIVNMPYGIFWEYNEKGNIEINREDLKNVLSGLGYRFYLGDLIQIEGKFIHKRKSRHLYDAIREYIKDEDYKEIANSFDAFHEKHGKHTIEHLPLLDENLLLKDTRTECYKFFQNGFVKITSERMELKEYEDLKGLIFYERIQQRDFRFGEVSGKYIEFLELACRYNQCEDYIQKILGYLSHEYKDSTTGYIIVQVEECPDPKQGGGSGKNLFVNLLGLTTTFCSKPGEQVKFDEKFLQAWNGERIFNVSDVPQNFSFLFLKDLSTGTATLKKLYKDEVIIPCENMCKFIMSTNYSYETKDGGLKRRIIPIEFTQFFTLNGGIDNYFGGMFPTIWEEKDWIGYDNLILLCIQNWIKGGLKLKPMTLSDGGKIKQFEQTFGKIMSGYIKENYENWLSIGTIENDEFKKMYDNYCNENNFPHNMRGNMIKLNKAIDEWSDLIGFIFIKDKLIKENGINRRAKYFERKNLPF